MRCFLGLETTPSSDSAAAGSVLALILAMTLLAAFPVCALELQHPKYQLQERRNSRGQVDRREGIQPLEIAGERLELIAVYLNAPELQEAEAGETYRLGFYLQEAEPRVTIKARDYQTFQGRYHYWMLPTQTQYARGFQEFIWDSSLIRDLGIRRKDFGAIAWLGGYGYPVVAPVVLHTAPFPSRIRVQGCRFIFMPTETMTVAYSLALKESPASFFLNQAAEKWDKDVRQPVTWDGRNRQGRPAPEGLYLLKLTATVTPPGRPAERIPYDVEFYYKPEIGSQR